MNHTTDILESPQVVALDVLKQAPNWVCYAKNKVPFNPLTGKAADSTDPGTWASYEQAVSSFNKNKWRYAGIGREFREGEGIIGIDLDKCIDEQGNISEFAQNIITGINSYAELSPSGKGVHIWAYGSIPKSLPQDSNRGSEKLEMYACERYFTWTGKHIKGMPETIEDCTESILALYSYELDIRKALKEESKSKSHPKPITPIPEPIKTNGKKTQQDYKRAYACKALEGECSNMATTQEGSRNETLNRSAFVLGRFVALGLLSSREVENALTSAAERAGLDSDEIEKTMERGLTAGITEGTMHPLGIPDFVPDPSYQEYKSSSQSPHEHNGVNRHSSNPDTLGGKASIIVGRQLEEMVHDAIQALADVERNNPSIFVQSNQLVKVTPDSRKDRHVIRPMGVAEMRSALSRAANFYRMKEKNGECIAVDITPPRDIVESIVSPEDPGNLWSFPSLEAIISVPAVRPDGTIIDRQGYDPETRLYYAPTPDIARCKVPCHPSKEDARQAMAKIEEVIAEFPFTEQADRANALGAIFTPFIRPTMRMFDDTPIAVIDAASPGTGKSMLASIICLMITGSRISAMPAPDSEEEWDKKILTELMEGNTFIAIDNIPGILKSTKLETVLTSSSYKGRILGGNRSANPENKATWLATGNNLKLGGDLPERCFWIRMVCTTSNPETRIFKIDDLMQYVADHRCELVTAILTVIRAWYVAGRPLDTSLAKFRTFTTWSNTIGSILAYAGIEGFLSDRIRRKDEIDLDRQQWTVFLEAWHNKFGSRAITIGEFKQAITVGNEGVTDFFFEMPEDLQALHSEYPDKFARKLGYALLSRVDRRYGASNFYLKKGKPDRTNVSTWMVIAGNAGNAGNITTPTHLKNSEYPDGRITYTDRANSSLHSLQTMQTPDTQNDVKQPVKPTQDKLSSTQATTNFPAHIEGLIRKFKGKYHSSKSILWSAPGTGIENEQVSPAKWGEYFMKCWSSTPDVQQAAIEALTRKVEETVR